MIYLNTSKTPLIQELDSSSDVVHTMTPYFPSYIPKKQISSLGSSYKAYLEVNIMLPLCQTIGRSLIVYLIV
jgi:hypothetical protein